MTDDDDARILARSIAFEFNPVRKPIGQRVTQMTCRECGQVYDPHLVNPCYASEALRGWCSEECITEMWGGDELKRVRHEEAVRADQA